MAISQNQNQHKNYIVLLDLSDRLLNPKQADIDKAVIITSFEKFEQHVKQHFYIKSAARFSVVILPQPGAKYDIASYNNSLSIDLSMIKTSHKRKALDAYAKNLSNTLDKLYAEAGQGKRSSDYQGVDIWKYFYNQLSYELLPEYDNQLLVLTDGYFDFESPSFVKKQANYYTSTQFFRFLNANNWKQISEERNYGLIPIEKEFANASVFVIGIKPKRNDLYEQEKLIYFWNKWVGSMDFNQVLCVPTASEMQLVQRIKRIL
ncbi:MAG: hypothetical protein B7C24_17380 [Bacteroidetes bacterium 4572_77]|nr:MAG: hypothetical protein B7C24_17380 [Bacteroidetes bacterium 4572_77]